MVTTTIGKDAIRTISQYIHPIRAQLFVRKFCDGNDIALEDFNAEDVARLTLDVAKSRDNFEVVNDNHFTRLLKELVRISNSE